MLSEIILQSMLLIVVFILSMTLHELGHYLFWRFTISKRVKFTRGFNVVASYKVGTVANSQLYLYYFVGVAWGLMPILFLLYSSWIILGIFLVIYLIGCRSDIKQMCNLWYSYRNNARPYDLPDHAAAGSPASDDKAKN